MASWRITIYASVAIIVFILFLILNFAYLPRRKLSLEKNLSTHKSWSSEGTTNVPLTRTSAGLKEEERELTLEDFKARQWNCSNTTVTTTHTSSNKSQSVCYNEHTDPFMCFTDPVHCKQKLTKDDPRQIQWPKYGEYEYLPKSKWKYIIVNGGVVFLYHPCAKPELVKKLKRLARSCLHRHVITPYENLDPAQDFAIVAWGCYYSAKELNSTAGRQWIQNNAMKGPATHVTNSGSFNEGLKHDAPIVSDIHESELCPSELSRYVSNHKNDADGNPKDTSQHPQWEGRLSIKATERFVIVRGEDGRLQERRKFDSANAAWALGSLVFLCGLIVAFMLYAKPCQQKDYWWRTDEITYNSNSKFSILKNRRLFWKGNNRQSAASAKLLGVIPEESDEEL
ncbi:uncharacterized protein LOC116290463 [Actinia tenebrosa]|uniref:Uncharacterized protein LOC116290463 n=1 Tax=Actinia tenebrosa TaxID=6105 RepID=A0A6P8HEA5_ACTTE|nr:uncharacterized protein LOC116290463 [Actinia tenebrosa]